MKVQDGRKVEHFSLQYMNQSRQFEEAWHDPVLREGSDLRTVAQARQWRVLILGEGEPPLSPSIRSTPMAAEETRLGTPERTVRS